MLSLTHVLQIENNTIALSIFNVTKKEGNEKFEHYKIEGSESFEADALQKQKTSFLTMSIDGLGRKPIVTPAH